MEAAALDWVIRLRDPAFDGWEAFEAWLGTDPAHAEAYHRLAIADADMADLLVSAPTPRPAVVMTPPPPRRSFARRAWLGGALAASLAGLVGVGMVARQPSLYQVRTAPGERKTVTLGDGTRIAMNGGTVLTLDRENPRRATIERGEALFDVVHDDKAPFKVAVGDSTLVDVGTRFNVVREGKTTAVQVAQGAVLFNPDSSAVRLDAGRSLRTIDGDALLALGNVVPASVAGWKEGRLIYDGQTMAEVADDLSRWSGQRVQADPRVADQRFRGVLSLGDGEDIVRLAPLLDVEVRKTGQIWVLAPRTQ